MSEPLRRKRLQRLKPHSKCIYSNISKNTQQALYWFHEGFSILHYSLYIPADALWLLAHRLLHGASAKNISFILSYFGGYIKKVENYTQIKQRHNRHIKIMCKLHRLQETLL